MRVKSSATKTADPKAESIPMRMPFPVEPSVGVLMLMTMFGPSKLMSGVVGPGSSAVYDVEKVLGFAMSGSLLEHGL